MKFVLALDANKLVMSTFGICADGSDKFFGVVWDFTRC